MGGLAGGLALPLGGDSDVAIGLNPDDIDADVYGVDVLFTDDLQVTAGGDYATVSGVENLRRAVLRRLIVAPGEYKLNPLYGVGIGRYVKKLQTKANLDELRHAIVDNISREVRITRVLRIDVQATFFGNDPGLVVTVSVEAGGKATTFQPFSFTQKGTI